MKIGGPTINRFFVKQVVTYVVYDRLTGLRVGDTTSEKVVERILTPRGLKLDERISNPADAKIGLGQEQDFHDAFKQIVYRTSDDKAFDEKPAKKT